MALGTAALVDSASSSFVLSVRSPCAVWILVGGCIGTACARDAEPEICPDAGVGDLVITELRGPQADPLDSVGQFIELYNASDDTLDLRGLELQLRSRTGQEDRILVRAPSLPVEPRAYAVLGHHVEERLPSYVDASIIVDYGRISDGERRPRDLPTSGILDVRACGESLDRLVFADLPTDGTWSLDGALEPNAELNDSAEAWCVDVTPVDGPRVQIGHLGTPKERNRPCP